MGKGNYIFGDLLGKGMSKVSQRTQYEASLLSLVFILFGIVTMGAYTVFFTELSLFIKIFTALNVVAGFVFLSSFLITTFQQYQSYLTVMGLMDNQELERGDEEKNAKKEQEEEGGGFF